MGSFKLERAKGEAGLTLVEVLAALVLLSIVFIGFMLIFPQMTSFNANTETKLETMNLARKELDIVKSGPAPTEFIEEIKKIGKNEIWTVKYNRDGYNVEVNYYTTPDLKPENQKNGDGQLTLYKVHILVLKSDRKISETLGYIELQD